MSDIKNMGDIFDEEEAKAMEATKKEIEQEQQEWLTLSEELRQAIIRDREARTDIFDGYGECDEDEDDEDEEDDEEIFEEDDEEEE